MLKCNLSKRIGAALLFAFLLSTTGAMAQNRLAIPPLLENTSTDPNEALFHLTAQRGKTEFFPGAANVTYGYNGDLLGPTIRARKGQRVTIKVHNSLREHTTVHWHGMLVPGDQDGGPHQVVAPDGDWTASFTVDQPAATLWYHPHGIGNTASQVYRGLAGLFIVDDPATDSLGLPDEYGVDDIPLIVQDRRFAPDGTMLYLTSMQDVMQGMTGNTVLVNGTVEPVVTVPRGLVRFRLLNGSNARIYAFSYSNGMDFQQIATDGGLLEHPVGLRQVVLSPGERAEIVTDFTDTAPGSTVYLVDGKKQILRIVVGKEAGKDRQLPKDLTSIDRIALGKISRERFFSLNGMGHMVSINGKQMDMRRIDEHVALGTTEAWQVTSRVGMMGMMMGGGNVLHNFHAHGVQFLILARNGAPPPENERGWKDTFHLRDGETVTLIARFQHTGIFMYHCHILEHEDNGMMGQFEVAAGKNHPGSRRRPGAI